MPTIAPHGGTLVNRLASADARAELSGRLAGAPRIALTARQVNDLELIAIGAVSPLEGFMDAETYTGVVQTMHLPGGLPWSMPITLAPTSGEAKVGDLVALTDVIQERLDGEVRRPHGSRGCSQCRVQFGRLDRLALADGDWPSMH